jgi:hypothetical protein
MDPLPVDDEVRRVARALLPRSEEIAASITEHVLRLVPELAPAASADAVAAVRQSTDQNIGAILATLAFGMPPSGADPPVGTRELLRRLVDGGGDVTHLLRAYRVGHELLWRLWAEHVEAELREAPATLLAGVLRVSSAHLFDFIDAVCQRIVAEQPAAVVRTGPGLGDPAGCVRALLGTEPVDLAGVSAALGYDLQRVHVALVATPRSERAGVRHELQRVIDGAGRERGPAGLALPAGDGTWWGWLAWDRSPSDDELGHLTGLALDDVLVGLGEPGRGRDGFRRSHAQARDAERVARLHHAPPAGLTRYRDVDLASVLCADPDRARRFAADRLGPLAERSETGERLRATVRAVLDHGHNRGDAARALQVHHKTVTYRVHQAESLLGRTLTADTADLDAALRIDRVLRGP